MVNIRSTIQMTLAVALFVATVVMTMLPIDVYSDPPPWAPALGWRKHNDPYYTGYSGKQWDRDYGVVAGNCDRVAVGAVLGAAARGTVGSQIEEGSGRQVAIVVGTITGAVIGAKIAADLDNADRGCMGHALELAGDNRSVHWSNPGHGTTYLLTPVRGFQRDGLLCREFSLQTTYRGHTESGKGRACQSGDGAWQIVG